MAEYRRTNRKIWGWKTGQAGRKDGLCCRCRQPIDGAHRSYCKSCYSEWKRERYQADPETARAKQKEWLKANPEKAAVYQRRRASRSYGLTIEEYDSLVARQQGLCAACGEIPPEVKGRRLHVDHDHDTGEVLGLLCSRCNSARGLLDNSVEKMTRLAAYQARVDSPR